MQKIGEFWEKIFMLKITNCNTLYCLRKYSLLYSCYAALKHKSAKVRADTTYGLNKTIYGICSQKKEENV